MGERERESEIDGEREGEIQRGRKGESEIQRQREDMHLYGESGIRRQHRNPFFGFLVIISGTLDLING